MITNREMTMQDYTAMFRRRATIILIPALLAPLAGFLISYAFPAKYTSQSVVLIEGQKVPPILGARRLWRIENTGARADLLKRADEIWVEIERLRSEPRSR